MPSPATLPRFDDVLCAAARIAPHAHATPVLRSHALDAVAGMQLQPAGGIVHPVDPDTAGGLLPQRVDEGVNVAIGFVDERGGLAVK